MGNLKTCYVRNEGNRNVEKSLEKRRAEIAVFMYLKDYPVKEEIDLFCVILLVDLWSVSQNFRKRSCESKIGEHFLKVTKKGMLPC